MKVATKDTQRIEFTGNQINTVFKALDEMLASSELDNTAGEFMLMSGIKRTERIELQFKHIETRDYIYLVISNAHKRLTVPIAEDAFNRGKFIENNIFGNEYIFEVRTIN